MTLETIAAAVVVVVGDVVVVVSAVSCKRADRVSVRWSEEGLQLPTDVVTGEFCISSGVEGLEFGGVRNTEDVVLSGGAGSISVVFVSSSLNVSVSEYFTSFISRISSTKLALLRRTAAIEAYCVGGEGKEDNLM